MRYLIRTVQAGGDDTGEYRDVPGSADEIDIGSGARQLIRLPGAAPGHALITRTLGGQLQLRALDNSTVELNGGKIARAMLRDDDEIRIGENVLKVVAAPPGFDIALIVMPAAGAASAQSYIVAEGAQRGKRALSWTLFLTFFTIGVIFPLTGFYSADVRKVLRQTPGLPSDGLWISGPLARGHQVEKVGANCEVCHRGAFEPVQNVSCKDCHGVIEAHSSADNELVRTLAKQRCASCHEEHNEPSSLVRLDQALCSDCHRGLKEQLQSKGDIDNVRDFGDAHPEFRLALQVLESVDGKDAWRTRRMRMGGDPVIEQSNLKFSHKKHLNTKGVRAPKGRRVMKCADCHVPEGDGMRIKPVRMKAHCEECHALNFDPCDAQAVVPHAAPDMVMLTVEGYYRRSGPRVCATPLSNPLIDDLSLLPNSDIEPPLPVARDAPTAIRNAERLLFERSTCVVCHEVKRVEQRDRPTDWTVRPVRVTEVWMPQSTFSHRAHASSKCTGCHKVELSDKSSEIAMPNLKTCRECHGGENTREKLASPCVKCHVFHRQGEPPLLNAEAEVVPAGGEGGGGVPAAPSGS